jgi:hypothetical protein
VKRVSGRVCVALAVLLLAACGGDDDGDEATPTTGETAAAAENVRLDQQAWDDYVETRDQARAVNDEAIATFNRCRDLVFTQVPVEQVEECLGTATADVIAEGEKVLAELDGFAADVSGACADATENLRGNVKLYISTVNAIQLDVEGANLPSSNDIDSALAQLGRSRTAAAAFERSCKPV